MEGVTQGQGHRTWCVPGAAEFLTAYAMSFKKEQALVEWAEHVLLESSGEEPTSQDFLELLSGFKKLLRQSSRLLSMGDRMQAQLNVLNREIAAKEALYRSIFSHVSEGVFRTSAGGKLAEVNPAMARIFGWDSAEEFVAHVSRLDDLFVSADDVREYASVLRGTGRVQRFEASMRHRGGGSVWVQLSVQELAEDGIPAKGGSIFVGVAVDVSEQRRLVAELSHRANVDVLTGLANRRHFMEIFRKEMQRTLRTHRPLAVMIADIDHFKQVNDTLGHDAGDEVLCAVAACMQGQVRNIDTCARLGGEEFVILMPDTSEESAHVAAERIRASLQNMSACHEMCCVPVTISIGVSTWVPGNEDGNELRIEGRDSVPQKAEALLKQADIALYAAKRNGRNRVEAYMRSDCGGEVGGHMLH
jgi:diguanylate cyclase (GGDEF)-like protein/PAS domain S-box-containing protein